MDLRQAGFGEIEIALLCRWRRAYLLNKQDQTGHTCAFSGGWPKREGSRKNTREVRSS